MGVCYRMKILLLNCIVYSFVLGCDETEALQTETIKSKRTRAEPVKSAEESPDLLTEENQDSDSSQDSAESPFPVNPPESQGQAGDNSETSITESAGKREQELVRQNTTGQRPIFEPECGVYYNAVDVTIEGGPGERVHFALDDQNLDVESEIFISPIRIDSLVKFSALAVPQPEGKPSFPASCSYEFEVGDIQSTAPKVPMTDFSEIVLSSETEGAEIFYTMDGSDPNPLTSTAYQNPFLITKDATLKALATKTGYESAIFEQQIKVEPKFNWIEVSGITPTSQYLNDMHFFNDTHGFAVGDSGTILKSTDGGDSWQVLDNVPTNVILRGVRMLDLQTVLVSGHRGVALKSSDAGATWKVLNTFTEENLTKIAVIYPNKVWIGTQGQLLHSYDKGETFELQYPEGRVERIFFLDEQNGWVAGVGGFVARTTNGGNTWVEQDSKITEGWRLTGICFKDANEGWLISDVGKVAWTTNGGTTWNRIDGPVFNHRTCRYDENGLVHINGWGGIFTTTDRGANWNQIFDHPQSWHFELRPGGRIWTYGAANALQKSEDAGATWTKSYQGNADNIVDLKCKGDSCFVLSGEAGFRYSLDRGTTWSETIVLSHEGDVDMMRDLFFISPSNGWAIGNNRVFATQDGGKAWSRQLEKTDPRDLLAIGFFDAQNGIGVGDNGIYFQTNDGGGNWLEVDKGFTKDIHHIKIIDGSTAFLLGEAGLLYRSQDQGQTWEDLSVDSTSRVTGFHLIEENSWVVTLYSSLVLTTLDGGKKYQDTSPLGPVSPIQMHSSFIHPSGVGIAGKWPQRPLALTGDFGLSWQSIPYDAVFTIYDMHVFGPNEYLVGGSGGTLFRIVAGQDP